MLTALTLAALPAHLGPGFGFGFAWIAFLAIPLFFLLVFLIVGAVARRRWMRHGWAPYGPGFGPGHGFGPGAWRGGWAGVGALRAEATLAERFAQGDIDETEYRARLEVLRANNTPPTPQA